MKKEDTLLEIKLYLCKKYFNSQWNYDTLTTQTTKRQPTEFYSIDNLLFESIEKSLNHFKPLLFLSTNEDLKEKISMYELTIKKWKENEKGKETIKELNNFIKDYSIDIEEIDNIILKLLNDDLRVK